MYILTTRVRSVVQPIVNGRTIRDIHDKQWRKLARSQTADDPARLTWIDGLALGRNGFSDACSCSPMTQLRERMSRDCAPPGICTAAFRLKRISE